MFCTVTLTPQRLGNFPPLHKSFSFFPLEINYNSFSVYHGWKIIIYIIEYFKKFVIQWNFGNNFNLRNQYISYVIYLGMLYRSYSGFIPIPRISFLEVNVLNNCQTSLLLSLTSKKFYEYEMNDRNDPRVQDFINEAITVELLLPFTDLSW